VPSTHIDYKADWENMKNWGNIARRSKNRQFLPECLASNMQMSTDGLDSSLSKKRRSSTDLSVEEEALSPVRKQGRFDQPEEVTRELGHVEEVPIIVKKPSRSVREAKKLHKERVRSL
jgi:hypothetical protein